MSPQPVDRHGDASLEELVARVPIFSALDAEQLAEVAARVQPRTYARNTQLYGAGEINQSLMILHSGRVKIYRITESGHEQVVRVLEAGDFLGESFMGMSPVDHFAATVEASEICTFHHDEIRDYLLRFPTVAVTMLETLSGRLGQTEHQLSSMVGEDAGHRVARYLLELADTQHRNDVVLPMAKKDVASFLGLTPETLSRRLAQFEEYGWIRLHPKRRVDVLAPGPLGAV